MNPLNFSSVNRNRSCRMPCLYSTNCFSAFWSLLQPRLNHGALPNICGVPLRATPPTAPTPTALGRSTAVQEHRARPSGPALPALHHSQVRNAGVTSQRRIVSLVKPLVSSCNVECSIFAMVQLFNGGQC